MPSGEYLVDPDTAGSLAPSHGAGAERLVERFSCAPGPAGWRYAATAHDPETGATLGGVDVTVDARWRQARVEVRSGAWTVRGGVAGPEVLWVRAGGDDMSEHAERAAGFWGASPAFLVTTARMLALEPGASTTVSLVALAGAALAARTVRQRWSLVETVEHAAEARPLPVDRYEVADLDTGVAAEVHVAGDVVVYAPGIELRSLDGPPNLMPHIRQPRPGALPGDV